MSIVKFSSNTYLREAHQDSPMGQVNPPFRIMILELFIGAADIDARAHNNCEEDYGTYPAIKQVDQ